MATTVPETAQLRVFAVEPPLSAAAAKSVTAAADKLLRQFEREGRCALACAWTEQEGRFVLVAWDGPALSGCSHDKLAQVLQLAERAHQVAILASPPIAVDQPPRLLMRSAVRAELTAGKLTWESAWWPLRAATLAEWRKGPSTVRACGLFGASQGAAS